MYKPGSGFRHTVSGSGNVVAGNVVAGNVVAGNVVVGNSVSGITSQGNISLSLKRDLSKYVAPQARPKSFEDEFPTLMKGSTKRNESGLNFSKVVSDKASRDVIEEEQKQATNSTVDKIPFDNDGIYVPSFKKLYEARALREKEEGKLQPLFTSSSEDEDDYEEEILSESDDDEGNEGDDIEETYDSFEFNRHK